MKIITIVKKICLLLSVAAVFMAAASVPAFALEDGAYTVSRTTSYVDPDTGETVDGGSNIALGDSMCASITEEQLLIEQINGKTYITIGLGLMSNIENVRIQVQGSDGKYYEVKTTLTGSCERNGDLCNHYRFEVPNANVRISPVFFVTPMGRDVQYFVTLDLSSALPGSGNFLSEMIPEEKPQATKPAETAKPATNTQPTEVTKPLATTEQTSATVLSENTATEQSAEVTETAPEAITQTTTEDISNEAIVTTTELDSNTTESEEAATEKENSLEEETDSGTALWWIIGGFVIIAAAGSCAWYFGYFRRIK